MLRTTAHHSSYILALFLVCIGTSCFSMKDPSDSQRGDEKKETEKKAQRSSDRSGGDEKKSSEDPRVPRGTCPSCGPQCPDCLACPNASLLLDSRYILEASEAEFQANPYFFKVGNLVLRSDWDRLRRVALRDGCEGLSYLGGAFLALAVVSPIERVRAIRFLLNLTDRTGQKIIDPDFAYCLEGRFRSVILMVLDRRDLTLLDVFFDEGFRIDQPIVGAPVLGDTLLHVIVRDGLEVVLADVLARAIDHPTRIDRMVRALTVTNGRRETPMSLALGARNKAILKYIENFLAKVRPSARPDHVLPAAMPIDPPAVTPSAPQSSASVTMARAGTVVHLSQAARRSISVTVTTRSRTAARPRRSLATAPQVEAQAIRSVAVRPVTGTGVTHAALMRHS